MPPVLESCSLEEVCIALGGSAKLLTELADKLEEWLKLQPHLPKDASRKRLEMMILNSKLSLERAKERLDMYYTIRHLAPEIYSDRNPYGRNITTVHDMVKVLILPKLTPEKYRTTITQLVATDAGKYDPWICAKYSFMIQDTQIMVENYNLGDVLIFDTANLTLNHVIKITPTFLKKCEIAVVKAYALRVKGIHLVNASPIVYRLIALMKSVLSAKLAARIHVHAAGNFESLYPFVPKSLLPKDYGGDEPTIKELAALWRAKVEEAKDWFLEQRKIVVDERLRPGPTVNSDTIFGFSGSFRKLEVD